MYNERQSLIDTFLDMNQKLNLSAIRDPEGVFSKHIQDSLELNKVLTFPAGAKICDVGTGGGFPLLPLAMTNPQSEFVGIDSVRKKVNAVNEMIASLQIPNAKVIRTRMEESPERGFDFITARAVGFVGKLVPRAYPLLKKGGMFIFLKQVSSEERLTLGTLCRQKNLTIEKEHFYQLSDDDIKRVIFIIRKN